MKTLPLLGAALLLSAGCARSDQRFERLSAGISKDSVGAIMGVEKPQRLDPYLVGGKYIEVMYFRPPGTSDSLPDRKLSPLILADGILVSWGWKALDSLSAATRIEVAPKQ